MFQEAMAADSGMLKIALEECKHVFEGLGSLVDVGGGTGTLTRLINELFPHMKCTVFDQPQVVANMTGTENLNFVGGDIFKSIPSADAVLLKWVLHDWNDELSVKILKNCKEAISGKGKEGKVIIIDIAIDETSDDRELTELKMDYDLFHTRPRVPSSSQIPAPSSAQISSPSSSSSSRAFFFTNSGLGWCALETLVANEVLRGEEVKGFDEIGDHRSQTKLFVVRRVCTRHIRTVKIVLIVRARDGIASANHALKERAFLVNDCLELLPLHSSLVMPCINEQQFEGRSFTEQGGAGRRAASNERGFRPL
ncbi:hypothetical protein ACSQ67_005856 [Phaseolus vulgaris]